jgi:hypothetical protein
MTEATIGRSYSCQCQEFINGWKDRACGAGREALTFSDHSVLEVKRGDAGLHISSGMHNEGALKQVGYWV